MGGDRSSPEFQFAQPNGRNKLRAVAQHAAGWTRKRPIAIRRGFLVELPVYAGSGHRTAAASRDDCWKTADQSHSTAVRVRRRSNDGWTKARKAVPT